MLGACSRRVFKAFRRVERTAERFLSAVGPAFVALACVLIGGCAFTFFEAVFPRQFQSRTGRVLGGLWCGWLCVMFSYHVSPYCRRDLKHSLSMSYSTTWRQRSGQAHHLTDSTLRMLEDTNLCCQLGSDLVPTGKRGSALPPGRRFELARPTPSTLTQTRCRAGPEEPVGNVLQCR